MKCLNLQFKLLVFNIALLLAVSPIHASDLSPVKRGSAAILFDSSITYYSNGLYGKGIKCLDSIVKIKVQANIDTFPEFYKVYNLYGIIYKTMGQLEKAEAFYQKALSFSLPLENKAKIFMNLGNLYLLRGDFNSAITYYNKVQSLISAMDYPRLLANSYYNMGVAYNNTSQYRLALKYLLLSIDARKVAGLHEDGETILNCATSYYKKGQNDTAELYFQKAIRCFRKTVGEQHYSTALAYNNYARLLVEKGEYAKALGYYNKCLNILDKSVSEKHIYKSYCFQNLGDLYDRLKDYRTALGYYQKSLIAKVNNFNDTSTFSNPVNSTIADIKMLYLLKSKAFTFERLSQEENEEKNLVSAFNTLELNVKFTEQLRSGYLYEASKLKLSENEDDTYKALVRVAAKLYEKTGEQKYAEAAFKYSEKGKYGILREFYNEEAQMKAASIPDSLYESQKAIRERLNGLRFQIEEENSLPKPDEGKLKSLQEQLFEETQKLEAISKSLENNYPDYARLKSQDNVVTISELQAKLNEDQVALEYVLSDSSLYTFLVTKERFLLHRQTADSSFYSSLRAFNEFLHGELNLDYKIYRVSAYKLYRVLIEPFLPEIEGKRLLVIPDKEIALVAFEALVDEPYKEVKVASFAFQPYLLNKFPIGYGYSSSLYVGSFSGRQLEKNKVLAFAPTYENSRDSLPLLPLPKKFLKRLTSKKGMLFIKKEATETNFKSNVEGFNNIHLYAHGYEDSTSPSLSRIFFETQGDTINDAHLFAHEISNLNIDAKLVVLASCYSGSGKVYNGEGVMSLGRSFLNTRCSAIVLSLWNAMYTPTVSEIEGFYKHLRKGMPKDRAMRLAKIEYLEGANSITAHPKYWAPLVVIGNQGAIYPHRSLVLIIVLGVLFVLLVGKVLWAYVKKERD